MRRQALLQVLQRRLEGAHHSQLQQHDPRLTPAAPPLPTRDLPATCPRPVRDLPATCPRLPSVGWMSVFRARRPTEGRQYRTVSDNSPAPLHLGLQHGPRLPTTSLPLAVRARLAHLAHLALLGQQQPRHQHDPPATPANTPPILAPLLPSARLTTGSTEMKETLRSAARAGGVHIVRGLRGDIHSSQSIRTSWRVFVDECRVMRI